MFAEPFEGGVRLSHRRDTVVLDTPEGPVVMDGSPRVCLYGTVALPATWPPAPVAPELLPGSVQTFTELVDCLREAL